MTSIIKKITVLTTYIGLISYISLYAEFVKDLNIVAEPDGLSITQANNMINEGVITGDTIARYKKYINAVSSFKAKNIIFNIEFDDYILYGLNGVSEGNKELTYIYITPYTNKNQSISEIEDNQVYKSYIGNGTSEKGVEIKNIDSSIADNQNKELIISCRWGGGPQIAGTLGKVILGRNTSGEFVRYCLIKGNSWRINTLKDIDPMLSLSFDKNIVSRYGIASFYNYQYDLNVIKYIYDYKEKKFFNVSDNSFEEPYLSSNRQELVLYKSYESAVSRNKSDIEIVIPAKSNLFVLKWENSSVFKLFYEQHIGWAPIDSYQALNNYYLP